MDAFIVVLAAVTALLAPAAVISGLYAVVVYVQRHGENREFRRQVAWMCIIGFLAAPLALLATWAVARTVFPQLVPILPSPWTGILLILLIDAGLLWAINTGLTWRRWRREGIAPEDQKR